jgi:hypothetical protein
VRKDPRNLDAMLKLSSNRRQVPVIVQGERVSIGFGGW